MPRAPGMRWTLDGIPNNTPKMAHFSIPQWEGFTLGLLRRDKGLVYFGGRGYPLGLVLHKSS